MPVNLTAAALATAMRVGTTTEETAEVTRLLDFGTDAVERHLGPLCYDRADTSAVNEAAIRLAAYLYDMPNAGRGDRHTDPVRYSGAGRILSPFLVHRGAAVAEGPDAALTFTATGGSGSAAIAWTFATADDAEGSAAVYKWQYNVAGGRWQDMPGGATVRSYTATGLDAGAQTFGLRAVNADAWGAPSFASATVA